MSNPEAVRNPDLITGVIIGSKSLFAAAEGALFNPLPPDTYTYQFRHFWGEWGALTLRQRTIAQSIDLRKHDEKVCKLFS